MSRRLDCSETDCFTPLLTNEICSNAMQSIIEVINEVVDWEGFRVGLEAI